MFESRRRRRLRRALNAMVSRPSPQACGRAAAAAVESLERRLFLTAAPAGPEFLVNTMTADDQASSVVATNADGDFVVAWTSPASGPDTDVYAQRFNAAGAPQGGEFRVNTTTAGAQFRPAIAADADGDFVVVWQNWAADRAGSNVYAQRYSAAGVPQGNEFRVNAVAANYHVEPTVAIDADGDFVVAWRSYLQRGSSYGIYARRYDQGGIAQGPEFRVDDAASDRLSGPAVAADANGDFTVAWASWGPDGDRYGVYALRYNTAGQAQGSAFRVNETTAGDQWLPSVTMDAAGDAVVAWANGGDVYARRYDATGQVQGSEFRVDANTDTVTKVPSVAADAGGGFVVAWDSGGVGSSRNVFVRQYNADRSPKGSQSQVNAGGIASWSDDGVAADADGAFIVTWGGPGPNGTSDIFGRRYVADADTAGPLVADVTVGGSAVRPGGRVTQSVSQATVSFSEDLSTAGGTTGPDSVTNPANWGLTFNGQDASARITSVTFGLNPATNKYEATVSFSPALTDGSYVLTARHSIGDLAGNALDGDADGQAGGDFVLPFTVAVLVPLGTTVVNTTKPGARGAAKVAADPAGDYVVAWEWANPAGSGYDVYARKFNAAGQPQGDEFRVNTTTAGDQVPVTVTMDAAGDFVVGWQIKTAAGNGYDLFAQRYSASGQPQGGEFRVNTDATPATPYEFVGAASDAAGDFMFVWDVAEGNGTGSSVYARRYDAAGVAQGGEFRVNTSTAGYQEHPSVAADAAGDFVVAWDSRGQDSRPLGLYARRYDPAGVPRGPEFQVGPTTSDYQRFPAIAADSVGNFVVAWESLYESTTGPWTHHIYAQRFAATGVARGQEFLVSADSTIYNYGPLVAMAADGSFAVTWQNADLTSPNVPGTRVRRYNAAGEAVDPGVLVGGFGSIASPANGDFVLAWSGGYPDSSVTVRRFGPNEAPTTRGISRVDVQENDRATSIGLSNRFADSTDATNDLTFTLVGNSNPSLFSSTPIDKDANGAPRLTLNLAPNAIGASTLTVRATDSGGLSVDASFDVTARPSWLFYTSTGTWAVTGPPGAQILSLSGAYSFTLNSDPAALNPGVTIRVSGPTFLDLGYDKAIHLGGLSLTGGARAFLREIGSGRTPSYHRILVVGGLDIDTASGSRLDLADGDLVLKGGGAAGLSSIQSLISSGYAKGKSYGGGIISSSAAGKTANALGYALNDGSVIKAKATFGPANEPVGPADVLVKYTWEGDANLDGVVSFDDYFYIDSKYPKASNSTWVTGDFDYNAQTSFDDYFYIDSNYPRTTAL